MYPSEERQRSQGFAHAARKVHILVGEGIECEKESERAFRTPGLELGFAPVRLPVSRVLRDKTLDRLGIATGDLVFLPGGFSFADHFGSGRLLAYELRSAGFFDAALAAGVHFMGICNGFQILTESGLFGADVALRGNRHEGHGLGFINRWVQCRGGARLNEAAFALPVRHGEGRLTREGSAWPAGVEPLLTYVDETFHNGSLDNVAGLWRQAGRSRVIGLMPHPEVALRAIDHPNTMATEWAEGGARQALVRPEGDGARFLRAILSQL